MRRTTRLLSSLIVLVFLALPAAAGEGAPSAADAFARLKELAGRWNATSPNVPDGKFVVSWRATAGGSAVMETMFEGTPHEMISMYFLDGNALRMTHYCAAGNQPRMVYDPKRSSSSELAFSFDGGTGFDPRKDVHIHEGRISFEEGGVRERWAGWNEGKQVDVKEFVLGSKL